MSAVFLRKDEKTVGTKDHRNMQYGTWAQRTKSEIRRISVRVGDTAIYRHLDQKSQALSNHILMQSNIKSISFLFCHCAHHYIHILYKDLNYTVQAGDSHVYRFMNKRNEWDITALHLIVLLKCYLHSVSCITLQMITPTGLCTYIVLILNITWLNAKIMLTILSWCKSTLLVPKETPNNKW